MPSASSWSTSTPFEYEAPSLLLGVTLPEQLAVGLCDLDSGRNFTVKIDLGDANVSDSYVREDDLVFTGEDTPESPVRTQAYIRALPEISACELILSRQTSLLDHAAPLALQFTGKQIFRLAAGHLVPAQSNLEPQEDLALAVYLDEETACCVLFYPGDADEIDVEQTHLTVRAFTQSLEKGVIRRVRVQLFFCAIAELETTLAERYADFRRSELPLTT
ncbi:hypothetical protein [Blastopirellula marina]|uniref:Uncharacterized protein n=1 Tax=Blastopirellula marina DSM 3645 TaxID=314230 RepID=A3ZYJ1_9BACT|nr:hypothetical protein [Blastopirellula marina]EAQ78488.1 hypothetical protein DSM3645_07346 [Blastopirellula marina DSM 3645]